MTDDPGNINRCHMRAILRVALTLFGLAVVVVGFGIWIFISFRGAKVDTVGRVDFERRLAITSTDAPPCLR